MKMKKENMIIFQKCPNFDLCHACCQQEPTNVQLPQNLHCETLHVGSSEFILKVTNKTWCGNY